MSKSSRYASGQPLFARLWERLSVLCSGWRRRSPPASSPPSSATLDANDETVVVLPEHVAQAIMALGEVAEGVRDDKLRAFVIFMQDSKDEVTRMWFNAGNTDAEQLALKIMDHGHSMLKQVSRSQGTAPPQNRSDREQ